MKLFLMAMSLMATTSLFADSPNSIPFKTIDGADSSLMAYAGTGPSAKFPGDVKWNFGKFLIARDGVVLARFELGVKPEDPKVVDAITAALTQP